MAFTTIVDGMRSGSNLQNRFQAALVSAAGVILTEDGGTPNHAARLTWANNVIVGLNEYLENTALKGLKIAFTISTPIRNQGNDTTDNQIEAAVTNLLATSTYLALMT